MARVKRAAVAVAEEEPVSSGPSGVDVAGADASVDVAPGADTSGANRAGVDAVGAGASAVGASAVGSDVAGSDVLGGAAAGSDAAGAGAPGVDVDAAGAMEAFDGRLFQLTGRASLGVGRLRLVRGDVVTGAAFEALPTRVRGYFDLFSTGEAGLTGEAGSTGGGGSTGDGGWEP